MRVQFFELSQGLQSCEARQLGRRSARASAARRAPAARVVRMRVHSRSYAACHRLQKLVAAMPLQRLQRPATRPSSPHEGIQVGLQRGQDGRGGRRPHAPQLGVCTRSRSACRCTPERGRYLRAAAQPCRGPSAPSWRVTLARRATPTHSPRQMLATTDAGHPLRCCRRSASGAAAFCRASASTS